MRKCTAACTVFIVLLYVSTSELHSQTTPALHDPQALAILAKTILAGGGEDLLGSLQSFTGTGTVTYYSDDQNTNTGGVTVQSRGLQQFRMDADLPNGRRTTVVNGIGGALIQEDGSFWPISGHSAADIGSMMLPYSPLMAAIQDSSTNIMQSGLVSYNGVSVYDIRVQKTYPAKQDPGGTRSAREVRDFYIDPNTFLVVAIADQIFDGNQRIPHEVLYSNYQTQSGVNIPLTVTETVQGVTAVTMQLTQFTFNTGLSDSDFQW